jgi:hypothetical protein
MSQTNNKEDLVAVSVADHLEEDPPIRGQNYACMSFVSPNDALASKDAFAVRKFLAKTAKDITEMFTNLEATFADSKAAPYVAETMRLLKERHAFLWDERAAQDEFSLWRTQQATEIDESFRTEHGNFKTSIQGFKIRGVYDSEEDARNRAKTIQRIDPKFHVFIAQVGVWCPWSPSIDDLQDSEYAVTQLNTLMKKYDEGQQSKDELYNNRKDASVQRMSDERQVWLERIKAEVAAREKERLENEAKIAASGGNSGTDGSAASTIQQQSAIRDDLTFHGTSISELMSLVKEKVDSSVIEEKMESVASELASIAIQNSMTE